MSSSMLEQEFLKLVRRIFAKQDVRQQCSHTLTESGFAGMGIKALKSNSTFLKIVDCETSLRIDMTYEWLEELAVNKQRHIRDGQIQPHDPSLALLPEASHSFTASLLPAHA